MELLLLPVFTDHFEDSHGKRIMTTAATRLLTQVALSNWCREAKETPLRRSTASLGAASPGLAAGSEDFGRIRFEGLGASENLGF